jgi:hypothetical protein
VATGGLSTEIPQDPLLVTKLPNMVLQPLFDKMANKLLAWNGNHMNSNGRLALVKSTLSVMPIYVSVSLGLLSWVLRAMAKIMKPFLWTSTDIIQGGKCLVVWSRV